MPITRGLKDHNPGNGVLGSYHKLLQDFCNSAMQQWSKYDKMKKQDKNRKGKGRTTEKLPCKIIR